MDEHLNEANEALDLTPQEGDLYKMHLMNLHGSGGVDNTDEAGNVTSRSSLYQATEQGPDGRWYNIPTVWGGKIETEKWTDPSTGQEHDIPNATALANVRKMGWDRFPSYNSPQEADERYMQMHHFMEKDTGDYFKAKGIEPKQSVPESEQPPPVGRTELDHGAPGQIDRSRIRTELEQNPALADRLNQMVRGEVGSRASPEVRRIQMETAMNRALARGHSLEQALWDTAGAGNRGYYPRASFTRGGFDKDTFGGDLEAVLSGSNYAGKYGQGLITGNASAGVAARQFANKTPGFTLETGSGPESYFSEGPFKVHPSQIVRGEPGTRLTVSPEPKASAPAFEKSAADQAYQTAKSFPYVSQLARAGNFMRIGELSSAAQPSKNIETHKPMNIGMSEDEGDAWRQQMMKRQAQIVADLDEIRARAKKRAK